MYYQSNCIKNLFVSIYTFFKKNFRKSLILTFVSILVLISSSNVSYAASSLVSNFKYDGSYYYFNFSKNLLVLSNSIVSTNNILTQSNSYLSVTKNSSSTNSLSYEFEGYVYSTVLKKNVLHYYETGTGGKTMSEQAYKYLSISSVTGEKYILQNNLLIPSIGFEYSGETGKYIKTDLSRPRYIGAILGVNTLNKVYGSAYMDGYYISINNKSITETYSKLDDMISGASKTTIDGKTYYKISASDVINNKKHIALFEDNTNLNLHTYVNEHVHNYTKITKNDTEYHTKECSSCGYKLKEKHNFSLQYDNINNDKCSCGCIKNINLIYEINDDTMGVLHYKVSPGIAISKIDANALVSHIYTASHSNVISNNIKPADISTPYKKGHTFLSWKKIDYGLNPPNTSSEAYNVNLPSTTPSYSAKFIANYKIHTYQFLLKENLNYNVTLATPSVVIQTFKYGEGKNLVKNPFTIEGYQFLGWSLNQGDDIVFRDEEYILNYTDIDNANISLYPEYRKKCFTINFCDDDNVFTQTIDYDNRIIIINSNKKYSNSNCQYESLKNKKFENGYSFSFSEIDLIDGDTIWLYAEKTTDPEEKKGDETNDSKDEEKNDGNNDKKDNNENNDVNKEKSDDKTKDDSDNKKNIKGGDSSNSSSDSSSYKRKDSSSQSGGESSSDSDDKSKIYTNDIETNILNNATDYENLLKLFDTDLYNNLNNKQASLNQTNKKQLQNLKKQEINNKSILNNLLLNEEDDSIFNNKDLAYYKPFFNQKFNIQKLSKQMKDKSNAIDSNILNQLIMNELNQKPFSNNLLNTLLKPFMNVLYRLPSEKTKKIKYISVLYVVLYSIFTLSNLIKFLFRKVK